MGLKQIEKKKICIFNYSKRYTRTRYT